MIKKCDVCTGDGIAADETGWVKCPSCKGSGKMNIENELEIIASTLERIAIEFRRATLIHGEKFNSTHEGYAVLKKKVDEHWDDITIEMQKA